MKVISFKSLIIYCEKCLARFSKLNIYILFLLIFYAFFIHFLIECNVINVCILIVAFRICLLNYKCNERKSISFSNIIINVVLKHLVIIVIICFYIVFIFLIYVCIY